MRKFKFKNAILAITVIISMLAPMLCNDIVYAVDGITEKENISSENTGEIKEEKDNEESNNSSNEVPEPSEDEDIPTDETKGTPAQNNEVNNEEPKDEDKESQIISKPANQNGEDEANKENEVNQINATALEAPTERTVLAGTGTLQTAINEANSGDTLILTGGRYDNKGPITIDKSITIKGTGNVPYIYEEIQIKNTTASDNIVLEGFSSGMFRVQDEFDYIDIQSPVNLSIKNLILRGVGGLEGQTGKRLPSLINIESTADETTVDIDNSSMIVSGDGIRIASSETHINISNSSDIQATTAIKLNNGSNNTFNIENSKISAYVTTSSEDEAISIVNQKSLNITIDSCQISGADAGGKKDISTKLFSIDDEGTGHSQNVNIQIKGNTEITEKDDGENNCIFNFGPNNTPDDNITAHVDAGVKFPLEKVSTKYNNTDDKKYVVVGVYDRYENGVFGNLDIKTYNRDEVVEGIKDYVPKVEKGHRFDKWMYKDNTEVIQEFKDPYQATKNMEVFPQYVETVDVKIGDKTYTIDKGQSLTEGLTETKEEAKAKLEEIKNDLGGLFTKFVDTVTGETFENAEKVMEHKFSEDTEIRAVNDIVLTVGGQTFEIKNASNKTLSELAEEIPELKDIIAKLKKEEGKEFSKFVNQNNEEVKDDTKIIKDTVLTPKYTVDVKIKKNASDSGTTFTLEENQTLKDLEQSGKNLVQEIKDITEKHFKHFVDKDGTVVEESTPITKHTELTAKYTVKVTIKKSSSDPVGKTYTLDENQTLEDLTEAEKSEWREYIKGTTNKEFIWFNEIEDVNTPITKDITLTPRYNIVITIKTENGDETFTIEEGKKLADIEDQDRYEETMKKENRTFSRFVYIDAQGTEQTFDIEKQTINEDITLTPKFNVKVTINKAEGPAEEFYIEENQKLGDIKQEDKDRYEATMEKANRTFSRFVYTENGVERTFNVEETPINDNITLTPKFNVKVTINKAEGPAEVFDLEENLKLKDLNLEYKERYEETKKKTNRTFSRFVYTDTQGTEQTFDVENQTIKDDITLTPKFNVKVIINKAEGPAEEFYIEENQKLGDIKQEDQGRYEETKKKTNREFSRFVYTENNEEKTFNIEDTQINDNITLTPKFNVTITIGQKTYLLEEGLSLVDLINNQPEVESELGKLKVSPDNKEFSRFVNEKGETITENTIFDDNTNILPKFKITITVEIPDGTSEEYVLEEGQTLNDLTAEEKQRLDEIKGMHEEGEQFAGFVDTATGNIISESDKLDKDTTLKATYEAIPITPTNPEENKDSGENKEVVSDNSKSGNPKTSDEIVKYIISGLLGITCIIGSTIMLKKRKK